MIETVEYTDVVDRQDLKRMKNRGVKHLIAKCTGLDKIDLKAASYFGIKVHNITGYSVPAVPEYYFLHLLWLARQGTWALRGQEISNKKLAVVGHGNIGKGCSKIAKGFNMKVKTFDIHNKPEKLEQILEWCDFCFVCLPSTPETRKLFKKRHYEALTGKIVVNCAREDLLNERMIADAVISYGLDEGKTIMSNHSLNTPHNAYNTKEAIERREKKYQKLKKKLGRNK